MATSVAGLVVRFLLAWLLLTVGWSKVPRRREFRQAVRGYGLLPERMVSPATVSVISIEIAVGVVLLIGLGTRFGAAIAGMSLGAYAVAMALNLSRGTRVDCGCASKPREISRLLVVRNLVLVGAATFLAVEGAMSLSIDQLYDDTPLVVSNETGAALMLIIAIVFAGVAMVRDASRLSALVRGSTGAR